MFNMELSPRIVPESSHETLLQKLKSISYQPTAAVENLLAEQFKTELQKCIVKNKLLASEVSNLHHYLQYVLAIAEKDDKFIPLHIKSSNQEVYDNLTSIIRDEMLLDTNPEFYFETLLVIFKIMQYPDASLSFSQTGLHRFLIFATTNRMVWADKIKYIGLCLDVFEILTQVEKILPDLSTVNSLKWSINVLQALSRNNNDHQFFIETVLRTLNFIDDITNQEYLSNIYHLGSFKEVFIQLLKLMPEEHQELLMMVQEKITSLIINHGRIIRNAIPSPTKPKTIKYEKGFELNISQLKMNAVTSPKIPCLESNDEQFILHRFQMVEMSNPETNVYIAERKAKDISMDTISQLICGMLNSSKGGHIHLGIHPSGRIEGVRISHAERDGFRSGIDNIFFNELTPLLLPDLVRIQFYPVVCQPTIIENLCVIKVTIPPQLNIFHMKKQNCCFKFIGGENKILQLPDIRLLAVMMTEKRIAALSSTE